MTTTAHGPALSPREFQLFQELMYREAGVRLGPAKQALVQNRLRKRVVELGLGSYRAYHDHLRQPEHADELQTCLNRLTTNETYFFRHKHHWDFFTGPFVAELRRPEQAPRPVRVWSAAASTGAEAYSAAIALADAFAGAPDRALTVEATDLNAEVLAAAREGLYDDYALQKLTDACRRRYFEPVDGGRRWRVRDAVRRLVRFGRHNLMTSRRGAPYDLVFLRNVLIYFDEASKRVVLDHVTRTLRPGGVLILGGAESLSACKEAYDYLRPTIYRKRGTGR